jgi:hypothetical protein
LSSSRKLLRLLSLICGILLIVASPFFIFHTEETEYPYPYYSSNTRGINPPPGIVYYNYNSYYVFFGMLLLAAGIVLIVASYYRHGEANNLATVLFRQNVVAREFRSQTVICTKIPIFV